MDVPRRRLDLTLLLEGVLVGIASRTRFLAGNRKASNLRRPRGQHITAWPLARDPPPRIVSWSRLVFNTCAPQPLKIVEVQVEGVEPPCTMEPEGSNGEVHLAAKKPYLPSVKEGLLVDGRKLWIFPGALFGP